MLPSRCRLFVGIALAGLACGPAVAQSPQEGPPPTLPTPGGGDGSGKRLPAPEPPWASPLPAGGPLQVTQKHEGDLGQLTAKVVVQQGPGAEDPLAKRAWQTDQAWRLPLTGPFF